MDRLKTILGILAIGLLIYLYTEHFPDISQRIQKFLSGDFSFNQEKNIPSKKETSQNISDKKQNKDSQERVSKTAPPDMFQPIDEYERRAEEEIDKLLELE